MLRQTTQTFNLPVWCVMTVVGSADAAGNAFDETHSGDPVFICAVSGASTTIGPFVEDKIVHIYLDEGEVTSVTLERYDLAALAADLAAFKLARPTQEFAGDGAPVDYTDGDPAATGEGVAEIGARYTDITNGKLYLNGGTKAQPVWKLVTSAT